MVGSFYPITGIQVGRGPNGEVPVRLEVDDWWESKDPVHLNQHTLAFTALNRMYEMSPHDKLSYYQIAGIHNQPIVPWDNTPFENKNYCMHSSANFPTWHRPYNCLLEQRLYEVMVQEIIPKFPESEQADLKAAAVSWRFPFWDWASKKVEKPGDEPNYNVPKLVRQPKVTVRVPGGTEEVHNPFYQFRMANDLTMGDPSLKEDRIQREPYTRTKGTSRHAYDDEAHEDAAYIVDDHIRGVQNNDSVKDDLQAWKWESGGNLTGTLRDWFYRVLLITPYPSFATKKAELEGLSGQYSSLEDIHDVLHNYGGGSFGHMAAPAVGAFDPMFWLHHNNVDRMLDLWAGLHPNEAREWLEKDPEATIPLIPFRSNQYGDYHTARGSWDVEGFGYTYPETQRWLPKYQTDGKFDESKLADELTTTLNQRYNSSASAQKKAILTTTREAAPDKTISHETVVTDTAPKISAQIGGQEVNGVSISAVPSDKKPHEILPDVLEAEDYVANVIYEKYALDGNAFTIRFFIGPVPDGHHATVSQATTQVGEIYNFSDPVEFDQRGCENCKKNAREHLKTTGQVPLTNALLTRFKQQIPHPTADGEITILKSMTPEDVVPFLQKNFHWRVTDHKGYLIDKTRINSLKVSVAQGTANHFADLTKLSKFSNYKILYDITAGAASGTGAAPEDNLFKHNEGLILSVSA